MLEIRKVSKEVSHSTYALVLNDEAIPDELCSVSSVGLEEFHVLLADDGIYRTLVSEPLASFAKLGVTILNVVDIARGHFPNLFVGFNIFPSKPPIEIALWCTFDTASWKQAWTIAEYATELQRVGEGGPLSVVFRHDHALTITPSLRIVTASSGPIVRLGDIESQCLSGFTELHNLAVTSLTAKASENALVAYFNFPNEVAGMCEQYLAYFAQFLRDLGVEATTDLKHEAGRVLFSVTPDDRSVALDKIREALAIYVRVPASPSLGSATIQIGDIQTQQLIANAQHLQMQLTLAQAAMQYKDATIQSQQAAIIQQRLLGENLLADSLRYVSVGQDVEKLKDKEELLGGTVALTPYEGKGFVINVPQIFRYLRDLFKKP